MGILHYETDKRNLTAGTLYQFRAGATLPPGRLKRVSVLSIYTPAAGTSPGLAGKAVLLVGMGKIDLSEMCPLTLEDGASWDGDIGLAGGEKLGVHAAVAEDTTGVCFSIDAVIE